MHQDTHVVEISPTVREELRHIHAYITLDSATAAARVTETLLKAMFSLDALPERCKVHEKRKDRSLTVRSMPVGSYIIYYRVDSKAKLVRIMSVRHGARRQPRRIR